MVQTLALKPAVILTVMKMVVWFILHVVIVATRSKWKRHIFRNRWSNYTVTYLNITTCDNNEFNKKILIKKNSKMVMFVLY